MTEPTYQIGCISFFREDRRYKDEAPRKRNPIGFVHFGEPEEEPMYSDLDFQQVVMDGLEEFDDELHAGFTAPVDDII
jgi:hypothetical protein